uniref:hypothetical protein n=1 Tax=Escherichia coli TaxID=562 RepID=UPI00200BBA44
RRPYSAVESSNWSIVGKGWESDMIKEDTTKDGKDPWKITSGPLTRKKAKELLKHARNRMEMMAKLGS